MPVEEFDRLYKDDVVVVLSARLRVDEFMNGLGKGFDPNLLGDGSGLSFLSISLSFDIPMLFGFENNFIFDFSAFGLISFSGGGGPCSDGDKPGDECELRGNAAFAAVAAAVVCDPSNPF